MLFSFCLDATSCKPRWQDWLFSKPRTMLSRCVNASYVLGMGGNSYATATGTHFSGRNPRDSHVFAAKATFRCLCTLNFCSDWNHHVFTTMINCYCVIYMISFRKYARVRTTLAGPRPKRGNMQNPTSNLHMRERCWKSSSNAMELRHRRTILIWRELR